MNIKGTVQGKDVICGTISANSVHHCLARFFITEELNKPFWKQYVPQKGEMIYNSDTKELKVGDGTNKIENLVSISGGTGLMHSLTIGDIVFDGTKDEVVPIFDGTNIIFNEEGE